MNHFDLTKRDINEIAIYKSFDGKHSYIASMMQKSIIFDSFILSDPPEVQTICKISFFPSSINDKFVPRLEFRKIFKKNGETRQTERQFVRIDFSDKEAGYVEFWKMISFLYKFKDLVEIGEFEKIYKVTSNDAYVKEFGSKQEADQIEVISNLLKTANLDEDNIKNILNVSRGESIRQFRFLIENSNNWKTYYSEKNFEIKGSGEESVWHHFLKNNKWVLGLNLDIRFIKDFLDEQSIGIDATDGKGSPIVDFLGIHDYTVLVELKTPSTKIFKENKRSTARTNTWSFSEEFIDGVSQCLAQKFDWDKRHLQKQITSDNLIIDQNEKRTLDPMTILIVGNKKAEFSEKSTNRELVLKRDTFERFRRNNRNLEIVTFDELYDKANFIFCGKVLEK